MFRFDLLPSSATPIYRQIADQVARAIAAGTLAAGDELPSVRVVAQQYVVNPMTVSKAYSLLEQQGLVERRRGVGMIVLARETAATADRLALLQPALAHAAQVSQQLGIAPEDAVNAFRQTLGLPSADEHPIEPRSDQPPAEPQG